MKICLLPRMDASVAENLIGGVILGAITAIVIVVVAVVLS